MIVFHIPAAGSKVVDTPKGISVESNAPYVLIPEREHATFFREIGLPLLAAGKLLQFQLPLVQEVLLDLDSKLARDLAAVIAFGIEHDFEVVWDDGLVDPFP